MYAADLVIEALDVARQTNRLLGQSGQMITTQKALRASFWKDHPELTRQTSKEQNKHPANTHAAWCDYVKNMHRIGEISEKLAQKAIL
jgi:hemoglobin-like flavoprotein